MESFKQKVSPMLWFDNQAEEAAKFYTSLFPNSKTGRSARYGKEGFELHRQPEGALMSIEFLLDGQKFTALNGGPVFEINPSISFFATYERESEVDRIWQKLSEGGSVLMELQKYPWSEKYGWVRDRFGVSWQISLGSRKNTGGQSIITALMFTNEHCGQAEDAMKTYTSIFKGSRIGDIMRYGADQKPEKEGSVMYAQFTLGEQTFSAMDSAQEHGFTFNEGVSLVVACETQEEIDYYWNKLSQGGDPSAQVCGWLKDRFGVSWQVVPDVLEDMLQDPDKRKVENVTRAFLRMKKFDIQQLKEAFNGHVATPA
jgi:predicted 3-demethylubiquinone-9 3-methyltransferase (glyoxalase superfamily)